MAYSLTKASTSVLYLILLLCLTNTALATNVFVWGVNNYGQLGLGTYNALVPNITVVPAYQSLSVASIVAGPNYHIATMTDGTEYACGINFYGQLTLKTSVPSVNVPTPANSLNLIQNPPNLTLSIYATSGSAVGLTSAGTLYGWGSFAAFLKGVKGFNDVQWANPAQLTAYTGQVASAAVVYEATFFTLKNGNMYVSGINDNGRLGIGKTGQNFTNITPFTFFTNLGINPVIPSTSSDSVFAIDPSNGNVYAWGANGQGQLGLGDLADRNVPVLVSSLIDNWHILQILPGGNHTLALTCNGHILAWGSNVYGQVGQYDTITPYYSTPQVVIGAIDKNIVEIVTGLNVNYIRSSDNRWYVWGANANGALGFGGNATDLYQPTENLNLEALDINHIVIASTGLSAYGWLAKDVSSSLNCPISLVDECASGALKCGTNALCIDSDKSAFCLCPHSFYPNPSPNTLCSPIDYCTLNISYCDPAAACSYDSVLGTTCSCNNGFGNGLNTKFGGTGCTPYPTNCTAGFCTANAFCYVSNGRAYCNCSSGYTGDGYSNQVYRPSYQPLEDACSDIDECAESPSPCPSNSVCNNTMGSFTCSCNPGTTPALDGSVCVQNICDSNYSVCASGSNCSADDAGQSCSCPSGYYGDGRSTAYGGSGCTAIPVNNSTVSPATSTTGLSGSNTTNTGSTVSSSTTSTTGGTTPQPSDSSETTQDIYDQGQYTGRAPADPEYNAVAFNAAANTPSAIVSSGGAASSVGHTSREKGALAAAIVVFVLLFALAVALAVYVRRTRHNHLRTPIRYTNNPDNVVI